MHPTVPRLGALILLAFLLVAPAAAGQAARTTGEITAADLRRRVFLLAHDSMGGREPGGIGDYKATDYIASEFRRLGQ